MIRWMGAVGRFWYEFVVGDDWRIATGVVAALGITALLASNNRPARLVDRGCRCVGSVAAEHPKSGQATTHSVVAGYIACSQHFLSRSSKTLGTKEKWRHGYTSLPRLCLSFT